MFALIQYAEKIMEICPKKQIKRRDGQECIVAYKGCKYQGKFIASSDDKRELEMIKSKTYTAHDTCTQPGTANHFEHFYMGQEDFLANNNENCGSQQENTLSFVNLEDQNFVSINSDGEKSIILEGECYRNILHNFDMNYLQNLLLSDHTNSFYGYDGAIQPLRNGHLVKNEMHNICYDQLGESLMKNCYAELSTEVSGLEQEIGENSDNSVDDPNFSIDLNNTLSEHNSSTPGEKTNTTDVSNITINTSACDDTNMVIKESRGKKGDRKANFCCYCFTKQLKIARHLELKHKEERDVKNFISLPKGSQERRDIIATLRKKGNFIFNTKEIYNDGELIVARRPNSKHPKKPVNYKACSNCKGFFSKSTLRVHAAKCFQDKDLLTVRNTILESRRITGRLHAIATDVVRRHLFPPLREDAVVLAIRYDKLVIIYANKMTAKYKQDRFFEMIRQRMRLIGRFLISAKNLSNEIVDLASIYDPKFCDVAHKAIDKEAQLNEETGNYKVPTVASTLGTLVKQLGNILINECIKNHDDVSRKNAKHFLNLFTQEVNIYVNRNVVESQLQQKRRKIIQLPCMEDIEKLNSYLFFKRSLCMKKLMEQYSLDMWTELMETTLLGIQLFNRKRAGEIERLLIDDFKSRQGINQETDKDLFLSLSEEHRALAKKYVRIAIRGKLNRTVPVLLSDNDIACINTILKFREFARVRESNPYVFGKPFSKNQYLRACILMRKYSKLCGAQHPERLRGTQLRKHIATACMSLNLAEEEVSDLANFLGHAEKIHKDIYRQPISREILRMSKLLEAAQGNDRKNIDTDFESDYNMNNTSSEFEPGNSNNGSYAEEKKKKRSTSPYGSVKRRKWTSMERKTTLKIFEENIERKKLPSFKDIQNAKNKYPCLRERSLAQIKTWIYNQF